MKFRVKFRGKVKVRVSDSSLVAVSLELKCKATQTSVVHALQCNGTVIGRRTNGAKATIPILPTR